MKMAAIFRALGPIDLKSISRDAFLRWLALLPIFIGLLMRWGVPALQAKLLLQFNFDLQPYYMLISSSLLVLMPALVGIVMGFLLLDQRDDQTLMALQVTPLTLQGYLQYRFAMPVIVSTLMTVLLIPLASLTVLPLPVLLVLAISAAPLAPIMALALAAFAENKVQGFALMKALGVINWPAGLAYFLPLKWQLVCALFPSFWPLKAFWTAAAGDGSYLFYCLAGLAYQIVLARLLLKRFLHVMHR